MIPVPISALLLFPPSTPKSLDGKVERDMYVIVFHEHCAVAASSLQLLYGEEQSEVRQRYCLEGLRNPVKIALSGNAGSIGSWCSPMWHE